MWRKTKIVCTLGPASSSPEVIEALIRAGMDVARLNFAYGTLEQHAQIIHRVWDIASKLNKPVAILQDLPGRKYNRMEELEKQVRFGIEKGVDFIALSYVEKASDILRVKELLGGNNIPIIAKIERRGAMEELDEILRVSEGAMVARGDLGEAIGLEKVPLAQKEIIKKCRRWGKPVITATQMLESMIESPYPTRAEVADIANAVLDGTDAVMLSGETSIGKYPVEAVKMIAKIALEAESALNYEPEGFLEPEVNDATAYAACHIAHQLRAVAIVPFTTYGSTALRVAKYRPKAPILAISPYKSTCQRLSLSWGVRCWQRPRFFSVEKLFNEASKLAQEVGIAKKGDIIVITAGYPLRIPGSTNLLKIEKLE